jgi:uracil-DNA glycosylase
MEKREIVIFERLWQEMRSAVSPFPEGVADVPEPISGTAFFPGGLGLWLHENGSGASPIGQIMIVGQDFNSEKVYEQARRDGTEVHRSATWKALQKLLLGSDISLEQCFFTNLYMGLRHGGGPETGRFPGARDEHFVQRCLAFFIKRLEVVRPKLILTLGVEPFRVLATHLFPHERAPKTLTACVEIYRSVPLTHGSVTVVALTHPSFYDANVWRRKYAGLSGAEAEKAMIADGMTSAFSNEPRATRP